MALLNDEIRKQLKLRLEGITNPVTLHVFTQELECQSCRENRALAEEVAQTLPDKIKVEIHNFVLDKEAVKKYRIDKIPAIAVVGKQDFGVRFYGIPSGYEFTSLLSAIKTISEGKPELSQASKDKLGAITKPIHIKVFVTPTCPFCPGAVNIAHQLAVASSLITSAMIEITEFPHLAVKEQVMSVPKIVVTNVGTFEGALAEPQFVNKLVEMVTGGNVFGNA